MALPQDLDHDRTRGDTRPILILITDDATPTPAPRDITGATYLLTVSSIDNPPDDSTEVGQVAGTITDAPNGELEFAWVTPGIADLVVGTYFFDIEQTDAGGDIFTVAKGSILIAQDITKP